MNEAFQALRERILSRPNPAFERFVHVPDPPEPEEETAMATKVYGASDDLIEFEGDLRAEVGCYGTDESKDLGVLVAFSDGTALLVKYGKADLAIWQVTVLHEGELFESFEQCTDEEAMPSSDVVTFRDGRLRAWVGKHAQGVK